MRYIFGFDVSKNSATQVIYHQDICLWEGILEFNSKGFEHLSQQINQCPIPPEIIFEATSIYSRPLQAFCQRNCLEYVQINPLEASLQAKSLSLRRQKNDRMDAHKLAQIQLLFCHHPTPPEKDNYHRLRQLARHYGWLSDRISQESMLLQEMMTLCFPELSHFVSNRLSIYALTLVSLYPHPEEVLKHSRTVIKNRIINASPKIISQNRAWKKADQLITYAKNSYPAVEREDYECHRLSDYATHLMEQIQKKEDLSRALIQAAQTFPEFELYRSIPGIGDYSAAILIAELGDITRFNTSNQLNAYVGIDIRRYESGSIRAKDHINKRGNRHARKHLYWIIRNMIRSQHSGPNHIVDYYYFLKNKPQPKQDKVAVIACVNKLLKCLFSMVQHHTLYNYEL